MSYTQILSEDRRLVILRFLNEVSTNSANESVLETAANQVGIPSIRKEIRADLNFLSDAGCVSIEWFDDRLMLAKLTRRGQYVAQGKQSISGIKKPSLD